VKKYAISRAQNIRTYEDTEAAFASDADAVESCKSAHNLDYLMDYHGKLRAFTEREYIDEAEFRDVAWQITPEGEDPLFPTYQGLLPDYVFSEDLRQFVEEVSGLDYEWPGDIRKLKAAIIRAQNLIEQLKIQWGELESP